MVMSSPPEAPRAGDSLTPLRGFAALCVAILHILHSIDPLKQHWSFLWRFFGNAYLWVDFFFILSGFILSMCYGERIGGPAATWAIRGKFLFMRLARIYPLHLTTLMALIVLDLFVSVLGRSGAAAFSLPSRSLAAIPGHLLLIHSLGLHEKLSWNVPSWSISCEWAAYVGYCLVAGWLLRLQRGYPRAGIAICFGLYLLFCWWYGGLSATTDLGIIRCLLGFVMGVCLFGLREDREASDGGSSAVYLGSLMVLGCGFYCASWASFDAIVVPGFAVTIFVMHQPRAKVRLWTLETPVFRFLGEISYSIYLVHTVLIASVPAILDRIFGFNVQAGSGSGVAGVLILVLTLIVSAVTYHWIECPPRRWAKAWLRN